MRANVVMGQMPSEPIIKIMMEEVDFSLLQPCPLNLQYAICRMRVVAVGASPLPLSESWLVDRLDLFAATSLPMRRIRALARGCLNVSRMGRNRRIGGPIANWGIGELKS